MKASPKSPRSVDRSSVRCAGPNDRGGNTVTGDRDDLRFEVPLYTVAEAALAEFAQIAASLGETRE